MILLLIRRMGCETIPFGNVVYTTVANGIADRIAKVRAGNGQLA